MGNWKVIVTQIKRMFVLTFIKMVWCVSKNITFRKIFYPAYKGTSKYYNNYITHESSLKQT